MENKMQIASKSNPQLTIIINRIIHFSIDLLFPHSHFELLKT